LLSSLAKKRYYRLERSPVPGLPGQSDDAKGYGLERGNVVGQTSLLLDCKENLVRLADLAVLKQGG
jgi:hypothetical protein